ncbi:MAG: bacteriocin family protein [Candidatus Wallbacteria bacterium]|nr:bacteriocin family protein [Candidatus Wallbacteria bacterium]MBI4867337.1 bacteriocin family protein [Candidatus Wallbacteria bacterium]
MNPGQNFLAHFENPFTAEEWKLFVDTVTAVATRRLVGRRFLDVFGPLGPGVQSVMVETYKGAAPGSSDVLGEEQPGTVFADTRQQRMIPIIYKDFMVHWRDIETARQLGSPLDTSAAAGAAAFCAFKEDDLVFYGDPKLKEPGLMTVSGNHTLEMRDWNIPGNGFLDVVRATEDLLASGHYGPYAVVLPPKRFAQLHRIYQSTGVLEIENVRQLVTDGVFQSNALRGDEGFVLSTGRENVDLALSMDFQVAYLGAERMNHPCRVLECVLPRIKHPDAICRLVGAGDGRKKK